VRTYSCVQQQNMNVRFDRLIISMKDDELEQFCRRWVERKAGYFEVKRFGGSGDLGRDVVGFVTSQRHEGEWDNYQCKQYRARLDKGRGILAIGKVLYWASRDKFSVPRYLNFVAPGGINATLLTLINKPSALKAALIADWDQYCATKIVDNQKIALDQRLLDAINSFDFAKVCTIDVDEMLADKAAVPLLVEMYGADPGEYPKAAVPATVQPEELAYLTALVEAYSDREKSPFASHDDVLEHAVHGQDLRMHRERYFEADGFQKFYRDNTSPEVIATFRKDIRFGIHDMLKKPAPDELARVEAVMAHAGTVTPAGPLARYAYVPVKQGICHHLVNDGDLSWKQPK
jgi:hypothetical protein